MNNYSKWIVMLIFVMFVSIFTFGCGNTDDNETDSTTSDIETASVEKITAEVAQEMMASGNPYVLIDVRTQAEYDEGHIEGAILLPNDELEVLAPEQLKDKDVVILVYCRSGNRSAQASTLLVELGYKNVYDFGGIIDWPGEIVK